MTWNWIQMKIEILLEKLSGNCVKKKSIEIFGRFTSTFSHDNKNSTISLFPSAAAMFNAVLLKLKS